MVRFDTGRKPTVDNWALELLGWPRVESGRRNGPLAERSRE